MEQSLLLHPGAEMSVIASMMKAGECFFAILFTWEVGRDSQCMVEFILVHHIGLEISAPQMMGDLLRCIVSSYVNFYGISYRAFSWNLLFIFVTLFLRADWCSNITIN